MSNPLHEKIYFKYSNIIGKSATQDKKNNYLQAARSGNILVIDEADKAPTNVTCILKSLAESGEMVLSGYILVYSRV